MHVNASDLSCGLSYSQGIQYMMSEHILIGKTQEDMIHKAQGRTQRRNLGGSGLGRLEMRYEMMPTKGQEIRKIFHTSAFLNAL